MIGQVCCLGRWDRELALTRIALTRIGQLESLGSRGNEKVAKAFDFSCCRLAAPHRPQQQSVSHTCLFSR